VAQSWAATWHPMIGSLVICKIGMVNGIRTGDLPAGQRTGRAGLATRPVGDPCYTNDAFHIYVWLIVQTGGGKGRGLAPALGANVCYTTIPYDPDYNERMQGFKPTVLFVTITLVKWANGGW
jgi:hypothetical protein